MLRSPLAVRFTGYGLLGLCCQVAHAALSRAFFEPDTSLLAAPELWMFWLFGAGGLVLDGADELLRVPTPLRAIGLLLCIYALGNAVGWGLQQAGGDFPWDTSSRGFGADGRVHLQQAPYWFVVTLVFRQVRHGLDRIQASLVAAPTASRRVMAVTVAAEV